MSERQIAHEDLIKLISACGGDPSLLETALNKPKNLEKLLKYPYGFVGDSYRITHFREHGSIETIVDYLYEERHDITPIESIIEFLYDRIEDPQFGWGGVTKSSIQLLKN